VEVGVNVGEGVWVGVKVGVSVGANAATTEQPAKINDQSIERPTIMNRRFFNKDFLLDSLSE
jgi:hypothetical protein